MKAMLMVVAQAGRQLTQQEMWILIGLGAAVLVYVAIVRPMMRRKSDPLDRPPGFASLAQQRSVERQMQNLLVEMSEMARQITAQLDTRAAKLEQLIQQADQKLAELRVAQGSAPGTSRPEEQMPDPRHAEVYALADQGRDADAIAAQLGRPRGEVELILALRSKG